MAQILSPNAAQRQRAVIAARIQSPTTPFFLASNDDNLERAQARAAARAAAIRRKAAFVVPGEPPPDPRLHREQIMELFQNCIKLASENKINQKNTWELKLIDHLCEIIEVETEGDVETNFQKASCTLEAGVKIYSTRVDSVHSEAYKVLGGINRAGHDIEQDPSGGDANVSNGLKEGHPNKGQEKKTSPLSMLESSFEALNVKTFGVAFAVDPLYHQTSAKFDEGGAKGLLLNSLSVYGYCRVLCDSMEVPAKCMSFSSGTQCNKTDSVDLSFIGECVRKMVASMHTKHEISPTLENVVSQFDEDNQRPLEKFSSYRKFSVQVDSANDNKAEWNDETNSNTGYDEQESVIDEDFNCTVPFPSRPKETGSFEFQTLEGRFEKVDEILLLGLRFTSRQNAWAGPDHWKYWKAKCLETVSVMEKVLQPTDKRSKKKRQTEPDIDYTKALDTEIAEIYAPPKNPKTLLLPPNRVLSNTKLPEDCHYPPENLVKLFFLPNIMCLGKRRRKPLDEPQQDCGEHCRFQLWDDQNEYGGQLDDGICPSGIEESSTLVSQPCQVNKIEVQYDKTSTQVDVQALKETVWDCLLQNATKRPSLEGISFKYILASIPNDCRAAASHEDISPHLCFICLLHLANEHGLSIHGCADLDELNIHIPSPQERQVN